jgi:hypothetical protein
MVVMVGSVVVVVVVVAGRSVVYAVSMLAECAGTGNGCCPNVCADGVSKAVDRALERYIWLAEL